MLDLRAEIKEILYGYVACESITGSRKEKSAESFFLNYFKEKEYFKVNPDLYGAYPIEGDQYGRATVWAMVKGEGDSTIVLIHHNDVAGVEDFKRLKDYAFSPDELYRELAAIKDTFSEEAKEDFESNRYIFGRGVCDMKGGGAVQMALLNHYSTQKNFKGNVIVLGVPDEENLSAGMRAGIRLLEELKEKYALNYKLMINSEPHQRRNKDEGVFSFGSIGKVMPYVYIRGSLSHAGKVFEGFNPVNVMAEVIRRTEVNMELSDVVGDEAAPPPTWLYLHDNKQSYDVSMPLTVTGCLSILTLNQSPAEVMAKIRNICESAFEVVIEDMNKNYEIFLTACKHKAARLQWSVKVVDFGELFHEAEENYGVEFQKAFRKKISEIKEKLMEESSSLILMNFELVDFVYDYIDDLAPRVVIGLVPPYYPNVANMIKYEEESDEVKKLYDRLNTFVNQLYGQNYIRENFYTGISDLSYSSITGGTELTESLKKNMPFFGDLYHLPIEAMEKISMPCVNIGPWGKDFHKLTERVLKEDLYERTPAILDYAIYEMLRNGGR